MVRALRFLEAKETRSMSPWQWHQHKKAREPQRHNQTARAAGQVARIQSQGWAASVRGRRRRRCSSMWATAMAAAALRPRQLATKAACQGCNKGAMPAGGWSAGPWPKGGIGACGVGTNALHIRPLCGKGLQTGLLPMSNAVQLSVLCVFRAVLQGEQSFGGCVLCAETCGFTGSRARLLTLLIATRTTLL